MIQRSCSLLTLLYWQACALAVRRYVNIVVKFSSHDESDAAMLRYDTHKLYTFCGNCCTPTDGEGGKMQVIAPFHMRVMKHMNLSSLVFLIP